MKYGSKISTKLPFDQAVERAKAALKEQGFGVLCEIDVAKTMREKIGAEMEPYVILGSCNPNFAYQALQHEPELGLLLPCNVVVARRGDRTEIMAIDAGVMLGVTGNDAIQPVAAEVDARLRAVLAAIDAVTA